VHVETRRRHAGGGSSGDAIGRAHVDTLLIASPDRLARRYADQVWR